jgi:transposase InsO family protein
MSERMLYSFDIIKALKIEVIEMPFVKETVEMNREKFVKEAMAKTKSFAQLCREYHISRPTGYLWVGRYKNGEGFHDKSHAPFRTANKTPPELENLIIEQRRKEPALGAVKIKRMLENQGHTSLPCMSTINAVLKRNNLITEEASMAATPHKRFEKERPNVMWQCDFKGHYGLVDGTRCHPLSVIDDHSRFCICADAKDNERFDDTAESFKNCFRIYGKPEILLCDNGNPWGACQSGGTTKFEVWLMEHGILTIHIRAKHPQTQGKIEKFNGSFKAERLKFYTPLNLADADRQRQEYRDFYNNERPHHALELDTPAEHYVPSARKYAEIIREWEYGGEYELRKIKDTGYVTYEGQGYFLSEAYGGKTIAVKPSSKDGVINLYFRQFKIGKISLKEKSVISRKIYLSEGDPRLQLGLDKV